MLKLTYMLGLFVLVRMINLCFCITYKHWQCYEPRHRSIFSTLPWRVQEDIYLIKESDWLMQQRKYISCQKSGLTKVMDDLDADVEILDFAYNSIQYIGKTDFARYRLLVALMLTSNCVYIDPYSPNNVPRCSGWMFIQPGALQALRYLKYLDLSENNMKRLPEKMPTSIIVLHASFISLKPISESDLSYLKSLQVIILAGNCMMADPQHYCRGNFTILGNPFPFADNLTYIDISLNNWTSVPTKLLTSNLKVLRIHQNPISLIQKNDFRRSPKITKFVLSATARTWAGFYGKRLSLQDGCLDPLTKLEHLDLSSNMLDTLPKNFFQFNTNLVYLDLSFNCFKQIVTNPTFLTYLPNLKRLYLAGNTFCSSSIYGKITMSKLRLGKSFLNFPNLVKFSLGPSPNSRLMSLYLTFGVNFDEVDEESFSVFRNLSHIREINLSGCGILKLNTSAWFTLSHMTNIQLEMNQIGETKENVSYDICRNANSIPHDGLGNSPQNVVTHYHKSKTDYGSRRKKYVAELSLRNNGISDLSLYEFRYFPEIVRFNLSYNRINYIDRDTFVGMNKLQILDLRSNPIRFIHSGAFKRFPRLTQLTIKNSVHEITLSLSFLLDMQNDEVSFTLQGKKHTVFLLLLKYQKCGDTFPAVRHLDLSGNSKVIYSVSTNKALLKIFPNVRNMNLDKCELFVPLGSDFFSGLTLLETLSLRYNGIHNFPFLALNATSNLNSLDISHNLIAQLEPNSLGCLPLLRKLIISDNLIHSINQEFFTFKKLFHLDLSLNRIQNVGPTIFSQALLSQLTYLDLRQNLIMCDCSLLENFGWILYTRRLENRTIRGFLPECPDVLLAYYGGCLICENMQFRSMFGYIISYPCKINMLIILTVLFLMFIILSMMFAILYQKTFWKTWLMKIIMKRLMPKSLQQGSYTKNGQPFCYHAYVYYDTTNSGVGDWVDYKLLPEMENGSPSLRLSIVDKDDHGGITPVKQLLLRIEESRKTIIVLSKNFSRNPKCRYVISVLEELLYSTGEDRAVVLTFGNHKYRGTFIPRKQKINIFSALEVPQANEESTLFWASLRTILTS